ncbi:MAG: FAD-dependent oxidoreductase [Nanoarchaeota archaeon]
MKRVVVIGGGFAGAKVAKKLNGKCNLTLIDTEDYFEYTPGILRVLVEPEHYERLHVKHKDYLADAKIVVGHVKRIDKKSVVLVGGKKVNYDYLVIASGSHYNNPIKEQDTFFATRVKHLLEANKRIQNSNKIAIVGGGLVGIELAAEIATHYDDKKISVISSGPNILERNSVKTQNYATKFLTDRGVEIIFNERIIDKDKNKLKGESGKEYPYDMVFFTVGIKPNISFMQGDFSKYAPKGIEVNEYLQIPQMENIFVAGDVSNIVEEKTAQTAEKHGDVVANNIIALISGKEMRKYISKKRLMVISLGRNRGVIENKGFVMTGWIPALLKACIEKMVMSGFR